MPTDPKQRLARELERYSRQMLFERIGAEGQQRLKHSIVTLIGCGALGNALANIVVRAGIGALRIVDRDFIEIDNLQRQTLFDEQDIADGLPKAEAAARKLHRVNSSVEVEGIVADVNARNVETLCDNADLILDGTDNLETRYLINDVAVKRGVPWIYGACIGAEGLVLAIIPRHTACLRCIWDTPPAPGTVATCDTVGVLASAANIVASLQATEAIKILVGRVDELSGLIAIDAWTGQTRTLRVQSAYDEGQCVCCRDGRYEFLEGGRVAATTTLCGREAVQVLPVTEARPDFRAIADRLPSASRSRRSEFMLRFHIDELTVTLFPDGRAIVQGTSDPAKARSVLARYVGT